MVEFLDLNPEGVAAIKRRQIVETGQRFSRCLDHNDVPFVFDVWNYYGSIHIGCSGTAQFSSSQTNLCIDFNGCIGNGLAGPQVFDADRNLFYLGRCRLGLSGCSIPAGCSARWANERWRIWGYIGIPVSPRTTVNAEVLPGHGHGGEKNQTNEQNG